MLKIALTEMSTQCRVVLEGRMAGTGITRLRTLCARLDSELKGRALVIDIKGVRRISQEARTLSCNSLITEQSSALTVRWPNSYFNNSLIAAIGN